MKRWIRPVVLVVVFFIVLVVGVLVMNKSNTDYTSSLAEATLPVVSFSYNGTTLNELHGYTIEMDQCAVRDTIMPIPEDRMLHVNIATFGTPVNSVSYQIRNMAGDRLLAEGEISEYSQQGSNIHFDKQVENLLQDNEEYIYRLKLVFDDDREAFYYTRLERAVDRNVDDCISFAQTFHDYTLNGEGSSFIPTYMDAATGDATTLNYVDLSCTLKQITWAQFKGQIVSDVVTSIKEINDTYNVINLDYVMSYVNENGETEYYNVNEYYRLKYTETRMYVLNFERTMNQIFRGENQILTTKGDLMLGIRDKNVEHKSNDSGDIIAFVQEGELWCYNALENNIAQVFSFRSIEGIDPRENWDEHDIKIVNVDEAGSVTFVVYGYMNRGDHEGQVGIGVYHYDGLAHTVSEGAFIPSNKSYQVLKSELGSLLYVNEQEQLFILVGGDLYQIELSAMSYTVLLSGLTEASYASSESGRYFAYIDSTKENCADTITFLDLKSMYEMEVHADAGKYIRPLGFIDEDFIYGSAKAEDVITNAAGKVFFGMDELKILECSGQELSELKKYTPRDGNISGISVSDYIITVYLATKADGRYIATGNDTIMNRSADQDQNVLVSTSVTDIKETEICLELRNTKKTVAKMITAQRVAGDHDTTLEIESKAETERFYVYSRGEIKLVTDEVSEAIAKADETAGVVVDQHLSYIWNRSKSDYKDPMTGFSIYETDLGSSSIAICASAMLMRENSGIAVSELIQSGMSVYDILNSSLKDRVVLDVTDCTLDQVLYYVHSGSPVFALTSESSSVLITGYTASWLYYFDPTTQSSSRISMKEATELFENAGNVFITYM